MGSPRTRLLLALVAAGGALALSAVAAAADGVTLTPSATTIDFGGSLTLSGTVSNATEGAEAQIYSQPCGFTEPVQIATTVIQPGGTFKYTLQPSLDSSFFVQSGDLRSGSTSILVRPKMQLRHVSPRVFVVDVSVGAGEFFSGTVTLQRFDRLHKKWRSVAAGHLRRNSEPTALVAVSSATIRATVKAGTTLRASIGKATVGQCYRPTTSAALTT
jgi:hypothetical protein